VSDRYEHHEDQRVVVNDKRRIDPTTGEVRREHAGPFPRASAPGNPAEASQPITATLAPSAELESARQEAAERLADLQRVTAEYANYRKRVDRDRAQVVANAKALVLTEMLTVLDDIDRADAHGDLTGAFKSVAERLTSTLQRVGLTQFGAIGDVFDPAKHEAVQFTTSPEVTEQTVTAVLRHGYVLADRMIRAAVVAVTGPDHERDAGTVGSVDAAAAVASGSDETPGPADTADSAETAGPAETHGSHQDPGSSGGPGGTAPDGGVAQAGEAEASAQHHQSAPKGHSVPGQTTGDSGGPGGVAPDGGASQPSPPGPNSASDF